MAPQWRLPALCLAYLLYLFLGATLFSAIEHPEERALLEKLENERNDFLGKHRYAGVKAAELDAYISSVVASSRRGVDLARKNVPNWSFGQSFLFSATVITTIGYGQQTPLSTMGKAFCMLYALVGIPITLLLVASLVDRLMLPVSGLLSYLNSRLGHLYSPLKIRLIHLSLVGSFVVLIFLLIPASILDSLEPNWTWQDSFYYSFISLTTVGLGDFIPGDEPGQSARSLYKSVIAGYLILGVMAVMLTMRVAASIPELDFTVWFKATADTEDPERQRLAVAGREGPQYGDEVEEKEAEHRRVVRARSRRDDSDCEEVMKMRHVITWSNPFSPGSNGKQQNPALNLGSVLGVDQRLSFITIHH